MPNGKDKIPFTIYVRNEEADRITKLSKLTGLSMNYIMSTSLEIGFPNVATLLTENHKKIQKQIKDSK